MFHRPDNEGSQPQYTGQGVLSDEELDAISERGGEIQLAIWKRRSRNGVVYLRIHIEPAWQDDDSLDDDDDDDGEEDYDAQVADQDDDDIPF